MYDATLKPIDTCMPCTDCVAQWAVRAYWAVMEKRRLYSAHLNRVFLLVGPSLHILEVGTHRAQHVQLRDSSLLLGSSLSMHLEPAAYALLSQSACHMPPSVLILVHFDHAHNAAQSEQQLGGHQPNPGGGTGAGGR